MYLPTCTDPLELLRAIRTLKPKDRPFIISGDVNLHSTAWYFGASNHQHCDSKESLAFQDMLQDCSLRIVNDPTMATRIFPTKGRCEISSPSVTASSHNVVSNWRTKVFSGGDHRAISFTVGHDTVSPSKRKKRYTYKKADWHRYRAVMDDLLDKTCPIQGPTICIPTLADIIVTAAKRTIPYGSNSHIAILLPAELVELLHQCDSARVAYENDPSEASKLALDTLRSSYDIAARQCKGDQLQAYMSKLNPSENMDWRFLRARLGSNDSDTRVNEVVDPASFRKNFSRHNTKKCKVPRSRIKTCEYRPVTKEELMSSIAELKTG
eukprot:Tbor_TRINITY_DN6077_c1_g1::TRINITY_DN6077_c1_g1_i1::g.11105::m.11105